jgi:serralysin
MATPTTNSVSASMVETSGHGAASALIWVYRWGDSSMGNPVSVTWSIPTSSSTFAASALYGSRTETDAWHTFTAAERTAARKATQAWDKVAGITLQKVAETASDVGEVRFALTSANASSGLAGHAYSPGTFVSSGDVWMQYQNWHPSHAAAVKPGSADYLTLLHEIGHALGLKHPFETASTNGAKLSSKQDSYFQTVMSYSAKPGFDGGADFYPTTPMYLDIVAMQALYGSGSANTGSNVYRFSDAKKYWQTIYDTGGRDTIAYSGDAGQAQRRMTGTTGSSTTEARARCSMIRMARARRLRSSSRVWTGLLPRALPISSSCSRPVEDQDPSDESFLFGGRTRDRSASSSTRYCPGPRSSGNVSRPIWSRCRSVT